MLILVFRFIKEKILNSGCVYQYSASVNSAFSVDVFAERQINVISTLLIFKFKLFKALFFFLFNAAEVCSLVAESNELINYRQLFMYCMVSSGSV